MNILLLGGFLGSGKTTILSRLMQEMLAQGLRLCVIENEIGQVSVDDLLLKESGVEITTIMGGCVCCQVSGSLLESLLRIEKEISPDWVLVELTGLAQLDVIRDTVNQYWSGAGMIRSVCVVDAQRWPKLKKAMFPLISRQISGCDVLVVNKIELCQNLGEVVTDLNALKQNRPLLCMSNDQSSVSRLISFIQAES